MTDESLHAVESFLSQIKAMGRSSPAGKFWQDFYVLLCARAANGVSGPPKPLILAASGASDAEKHGRLREQMVWATRNGCLQDTFRYLNQLQKDDQWNIGTPVTWNRSFYP